MKDIWGNYDAFKADNSDAIKFFSFVKACIQTGLKKICSSDKLSFALDVGCGAGDLTKLLLDYANHVDAVDLSPSLISKAKQKVELDEINFECDNFLNYQSNNKYELISAIWFHHQLNTTENQKDIKDKILEMLTPNGVFIFLIPSATYAHAEAQVLFKQLNFTHAVIDSCPQYHRMVFSFDRVDWDQYTIWSPLYIYQTYQDEFEMEFIDTKKILVDNGYLTLDYIHPVFDVLIGKRKPKQA
ncbi:class I SAM-dependent DNA methyltransferase [Piscirickettsia litoralis]|uniref:Methyltransferase domain-containing protein n=1 Tax=Piscirickettsia litoralis TaxID=1891921 RepID=A0ABX3A2J6_9GAMM|nr:class I SAM-dependent methyltransferase [Piscirickettsia litoralis]ODN41871.1 hypothetical protein BGC07_01425 [Piscirickettsia litoralis]